jgi:teichuronic acid biosynthesis glycosyltransferase TuaC
MKILWVIPGDPNSKVNMIFAKKTIPALESYGFEIKIFYLTSRSNPFALLKLWKEARKMITSFRPEIVHGQYGSITGIFSCLLGRNTIVTFRGSDINGDPELSFFRQLFVKITSQLAAALSTVSIYVSDPLRKKLIFPGRETFSIPSPINFENFYPRSMYESRQVLNLPLNKKIISFISSGGRALKRPELAKATCDILEKRGHKVLFLEIKGVDPNDVPMWLSASNCMIFTSMMEGSPNAVREALACGLPVVSVHVGDVEKWIITDSYSRLAPTDSPEELADLVEEVWNLDEPRFRRANLDEVNLDAHVKKLSSIYLKLGNEL